MAALRSFLLEFTVPEGEKARDYRDRLLEALTLAGIKGAALCGPMPDELSFGSGANDRAFKVGEETLILIEQIQDEDDGQYDKVYYVIARDAGGNTRYFKAIEDRITGGGRRLYFELALGDPNHMKMMMFFRPKNEPDHGTAMGEMLHPP